MKEDRDTKFTPVYGSTSKSRAGMSLFVCQTLMSGMAAGQRVVVIDKGQSSERIVTEVEHVQNTLRISRKYNTETVQRQATEPYYRKFDKRTF